MLQAIAATTTGHAPADRATVKTAHLPTKPAVSGMPAIDSRKKANRPATSGERRPSPAQRENALGWRDAGKCGTKEECLAYIKEVWTDMRPLSLRQKMAEASGSA